MTKGKASGTEDRKVDSSSDQSTREEKVDQAVHVLTDIYRLLEEYAPVWYSPMTEKRLRAALKRLRA
jgi:hypothetical protein